jgi:hypothetical protein
MNIGLTIVIKFFSGYQSVRLAKITDVSAKISVPSIRVCYIQTLTMGTKMIPET